MSVNEKVKIPIIENVLVDMPNEEYHSIKEYISASQIKDLLSNPYVFFNPVEKEQKKAFDIGSAIHCLILEPEKFEKEFTVAPKVDKRTKEGKEQYLQFLNKHGFKTILESDEFDNLIELQKSVLQHPEVVTLLKNGVSEMSYFKTLENGIKIKVRPDRYRADINTIIDIKSCINASPDAFKRDIANYKYYVQAAHYIDTLQANKFIFLAVEKKPPYMVGIYELTEEDLNRGRELIAKALRISKQGHKYKRPIYKSSDGKAIQTLVMPNYIYYENEGE